MADEVEMIPVEAGEPPKADPLGRPAVKVPTLKLNPLAHKPTVGGQPTSALKPGLKLPPKPGATVSALRPGLKLPPKPGATASALRPGLKLPPKPGAHIPAPDAAPAPAPTPATAPLSEVTDMQPVAAPAASAASSMPKPGVAPSVVRPGMKLPTQTALKPGIKLPPKPVIRKPGATVTAMPLPKPIVPSAAQPAAVKPAAAESEAAKPIAVDAQGVGKLPTVDSKTVARDDTAPTLPPKPLEALKSVTQKLKGVTQEIPQQAILHKTGIISDGAVTEAQKEAAKHKTARISLADAMGIAPVKSEAAPMKTIRIKRPVDISQPAASPEAEPKNEAPTVATVDSGTADAPTATVTQRKTLRIARPGSGAVKPSGKFGLKRPSAAATAVKDAPAAAESAGATEGGEVADVAEIPDVPTLPAVAPVPVAAPVAEGPAWLWTLSSVVQAAACVAMGALMWYLYQNTQTLYF